MFIVETFGLILEITIKNEGNHFIKFRKTIFKTTKF